MKNLANAFRDRPKPNYQHLRITTVNEPRQEQLEARLTEEQRLKLHNLLAKKLGAEDISKKFVRDNGEGDPDLQLEAASASKAYNDYRTSLVAAHDDDLGPKETLRGIISRTAIDVTPPSSVRGELDPLGAPLPVMTAHNKNVLGVDPVAGEYFAAFGIVPVYCYDMSDVELKTIISHFERCHKWYRTPIIANKKTTVGEVRRMLTRVDNDSAVFFLDEPKNGRKPGKNEKRDLIGTLATRDLANLEPQYDSMPAWDYAKKAGNFLVRKEGIKPDEAIDLMENRESFIAIECKDGMFRILTETQAHLYTLLNPFEREEGGLDYMISVGLSKESDPVGRMKKFKSRVHNWMADTAHMLREDNMHTLEQLRNIDPKAIMAAGTVISPAGTRRILDLGYQYVKVGIGGGQQCTTTSTTGVGIPAAWAHYINGVAAAAHGRGSVIADGFISNDATTCLAMSFPGVGYVMKGSRFAPLRETATDYKIDEKGKYKMIQGEASAPRALERMLRRGIMTREQKTVRKLGPHAEGASGSKVYPETGRETVGHMALGIKRALQSWLSYVDANSIQEGKRKTRYEVVRS
jgi:IMP dehydrogenase